MRRRSFGDLELSAMQTVLVLDDEQSIREALREYFSQQGMKVLTAGASSEAMELLDSGPIDILISDIELPDIDGVSFASVVSEMYPEALVIFMSGKSVGHHAARQVVLPNSKILQKPFRFSELMNLINANPCATKQ